MKRLQIQLVFLHLLSSAVVLDKEHKPDESSASGPRSAASLVSPVAHSCQKMELTRDLFLPEWGEKQRPIIIFISSHSFYFPRVCILYTRLRLCFRKNVITTPQPPPIPSPPLLHYEIIPMIQYRKAPQP